MLEQEYASQRILSQVLFSSLYNPEQIEPASAFMLIGQRFVIDSFVTGNVVYDKVVHNGAKIRRMLPSTLDVLFALGNDAAAQLLAPELTRYPYGSNLAALRYLVDSYQPGGWEDSLYYGWLNSIRSLNPPPDRSMFPSFMQTAAWWQEKMNTQLAAWAQLRHDNLLYVKQSYTGGVIVCSFPKSLVEPIPEFYDAVGRFADNAAVNFGDALANHPGVRNSVVTHFRETSEIVATLGGIARKELARESLTLGEEDFLEQMLTTQGGGCGPPDFQGWYARLYYSGGSAMDEPDLIVADVHTSPTDEIGNIVGWVLHAGTGPLNMAFVVCDTDPEAPCAFVGPVMSYRERVTGEFKRLTDEEWVTEHATSPTYRPQFVDLYMADERGQPRGNTISLFLGEGAGNVAVEPQGKLLLPLGALKQTALLQNYPNPFNPETWVPYELATAADVTIDIYDASGRLVRRLPLGSKAAGSYVTQDKAAHWDGRDDRGQEIGSGVYFYHLQTSDASLTRRMVIRK